MMKNTMTKAQAVATIRDAVAQGWARKVEILPGGTVTVTISRSVQATKWSTDWACVIVNFRRPSGRGRRWSTSVMSFCDYNRMLKGGAWDARYQINRLNNAAREAARFDRSDAEGQSLASANL
jgi:hypothetical protein